MNADILIAGATGNTGLPLVKQLAAAGVPVRALIHSPAKKPLVESKNVDVVEGDFAIAGLIERALEGISRAYLVSPASPDQVRYQINFVNVAKMMGVRHIVKLSEFGAAPDSPVSVLRWHAEIEEHIRKSGINHTFLHPHFFMENLLANVESVKKDGAIYSPLGDAKISTISVHDVASAAAAVLTGGAHEGRTYILTGPEALSYADIARIVGDVIGRPVKYVHVTYEQAKAGMIKAGMPAWLAEDLIRLMQSWGDGKGSIVSQYGEKLTGKKPVSMHEFILKHKGLFLAAA
jgi:uncharacterized protein YbjT (DUF2867 family)